MAMIKQPIKSSNPLQFPLYSTVRQNLPLKSFLSTSISSATKAFGRLTCKCNAFCYEMSKDVGALVREFDPAIPLDKAVTPPSSWYTNSAFLPLEMERVFYRGWQAVGGIDGHVYVSPLFCQEIKLSSSTVLCNLGQPILALLAIHSGNSGHKSGVLKNDISGKQPEREHLEVRDTLLIVGRYGRIVVISCNEFEDNSCFISSSCTRQKELFEINLEKCNFDIRDWEVQAPLISVCMLGSQHLCYCAGSEVFISLLFEDRDIQKSVGMVTENMPNQSAEYGIGLRRQDAVQNNASKNDLQRARYVLKEILLPKKIPVADSLIGVTGKDFSVSNISGRPLVVLTARGRILGVEIAQYPPTPEGCYTGPIPKKTWRTWESNIDDHVKKLINIIDDISRSASYIQQCNQALNLAIAELSISLKVASSILTDPNRDRLLRPSPPNSTCVSNTRLSTRCSIKAGDKVILSIPGGEIISILLKYVRDEQILLHFEAPTLLLGCLLKEALTWRLKNCKEIGSSQNRKTSLHSFPVSQDLTDRNMTDAKPLETKKQLEVILHRAEALTTIWNEIKPQDARDTKEVLPVLADIHSVINDLLKLYKSHRES